MQEPDFSPAAERNKRPILDVLCQVSPERGTALEIASGTGQHVAWFAAGLPRWTWQPTDAQPTALASIAAWVAQQGLMNVHPPIQLDVMSPNWLPPTARFDLIYCANMLHIAPWSACAALMRGSALHLTDGGCLVTYGPYIENSVATSPGNQLFDTSLQEQNPEWGIRRREDVELEADQAGLCLAQRHGLPSNNLLLVWTRKP